MNRNVEYYLSKGFDNRTAEYFASGRKRITDVIPNDDFTLTLTFDNGERRLYDTKPFLKPNTVFETFMNISDFKRVYLDDTHCVCWDIDPNIDSETVWNNKVDISPDGCYLDSIPIQEENADA